ncbi:AfsR/SARP family transcriptional regulator [Streptomyces sp. ISL-36]|uniref:AfsR/SARP family transcriptional regulator n=1 Tax=Streptomyces sp. ISL-36 TaxID=2819182 RepID=UPI001BE6FDC3|nr:AfsR/SARP family transcriptional regulator [Streptomyces sp. ISL-36]MBT2438947.1 AfsR/SARP family transcriptional regulator [Streptomyces sp. ISL-36]
MDVGILGPLAVRLNGQSIVPSAGKPRQLLALLAIRAERVVTVPTLMEEIWGDAIPKSAATTLQTYILHLRRKVTAALRAGRPGAAPDLGGDAKAVLTTCFGGYRLAVRPEDSDLREFQSLAARGSVALEAGDARAASAMLERALGLWRGTALVDVPVGRVLGVEVLGMEEQRTRVLEQRIEADLLLGRHASLLAELRMLVARHPMNENLAAQLMTALYRSGGVWRALEVFQELRRTLIEELGVEPSHRLQRLHRAVLSGEPELEPRHAGLELLRAGG